MKARKCGLRGYAPYVGLPFTTLGKVLRNPERLLPKHLDRFTEAFPDVYGPLRSRYYQLKLMPRPEGTADASLAQARDEITSARDGLDEILQRCKAAARLLDDAASKIDEG